MFRVVSLMSHLLSSPTWTNVQYLMKKRLSSRPHCSSSWTELSGQALKTFLNSFKILFMTLLSFSVLVWLVGFVVCWVFFLTLEKWMMNDLCSFYKLYSQLDRLRAKRIKKSERAEHDFFPVGIWRYDQNILFIP